MSRLPAHSIRWWPLGRPTGRSITSFTTQAARPCRNPSLPQAWNRRTRPTSSAPSYYSASSKPKLRLHQTRGSFSRRAQGSTAAHSVQNLPCRARRTNSRGDGIVRHDWLDRSCPGRPFTLTPKLCKCVPQSCCKNSMTAREAK